MANTIARLVSFFIPRWIHVARKQHEKSPQLIGRVLNAMVYLLAFLIVLDHFHVEITPIIAALGVGGLAIGLALQAFIKTLKKRFDAEGIEISFPVRKIKKAGRTRH